MNRGRQDGSLEHKISLTVLRNTECVTEAECDHRLGEYLIILLKIIRKAPDKGMAVKVGGRKM